MELVILQSAAGQHLGGLGGKLNFIARRCRVGVDKLGFGFAVFGFASFRNGVICHLQLAAAVVRDGNRHTVGGAVIRNTGDFTFGGDILGDVVLINAGFGEGDTSEAKGNLRSVGGETFSILNLCLYICISHIISQRGTIDSFQCETEMIAFFPIAARQNLYALERVIGVIRVHGNRVGVIGVCHRDFFGCTCRDLALAVGRNGTDIVVGQILFRDGIGAACGQAHNLGSLAVFQFEVTVVLDGSMGCLSAISIGNGVVILGIGVQGLAIFARQRKLHRKIGVAVRGQTRVGCNHLGNLQAAGGVHGQLTVVAKVQHTLVCVKIPLEVNAALRGAGCVTGLTIFVFLIAQLAINGGGQAAFFGVRLDVAVAIFFFFNATLDFLLSCNANGHIVGLVFRNCMIAIGKMQIVQLIVVDFARFYSCGLRIRCACTFTRFGIQQGILGVIVEVIAYCRGKGGSGRADGCFAVCRCFGVIKFVGVEADCAVLGVILNIGGKGGVGKAAGRNLLAHTLFKADRVDNADGLGVVDFQRRLAIGVCDLIIPQGQHTGRDLDLHTVALCAAAMGDGDNDVFQIGCLGVGTADRVFMLTLKDIGIHRVGGFCFHLLKDLVGKGNGLKALDFHIIAQGIIESHIAFFLGLARNLRGACQCDRYGIEDVLKDLAQLRRAGSRHIVVWIVRSVAEVPFPGTEQPRCIIRFPGVSGRGVVAGDRLHELVFFCRPVIGSSGVRVSTAENTNGVNFTARSLDFFSCCDGRGSYRILKRGSRGRRTIRKENDDLFGTFARRFQCVLGANHAIIRSGGTGRAYGIYRVFECSSTVALADSKLFHNLRVVICIPTAPVSIVTHSIGFISGKFHDGKPDFFIVSADLVVLFRSFVNKVIHRIFQSCYAGGTVAASHRIIHTAGGIQYHDNVQGLCVVGGGRRIGRQRRQCDQKIGAFLFGHRDGVLTCQVSAEGDFIFLHRFVCPNTACGGVIIALRILPRVKRVRVADGCTVGSCLRHGGFPLCIGRDRNQHREQ